MSSRRRDVRVEGCAIMKIVILGGSAQSTPALWSYLSRHAEGLDVVLMGRDAGRLQAVCRACRALSETGANTLDYRRLDDPAAWNGLEDTSAFVIQVRNGGYAARDLDETLPLEYGVCGDEGLGPGGLCAGIRNWRAVEPLLTQIALTAPDARVMIVSSPVSLLVRAASRVFPQLRIAGICELPWTTLLKIGDVLNVPAESIDFDYIGVNHLGWFYRLEVEGQDIIQAYAHSRRDDQDFPSAAVIEACGAVPLEYLRLHYERESFVDSQRQNGRSRGTVLRDLSERAFEVYAKGTVSEIQEALERRPAPWYPHAIGPFLAFIAGRSPRLPFFLSVPDGDTSDILECAHVGESGGLRRLPLRSPVPPHIKDLLMDFVRYERLAAQALLTAARADIETPLDAHPWTREVPHRKQLARAIVSR
jgi:6-phospho-beta-glucosidase